tara:strand:- start:157 stop:390 length:234 start_codon:yes stop_codon:yes gene_type:complete
MRRIMKLTPATIKKIIAEEKQKIDQEQDRLLKEQKASLLKKLRLLKKIKNKQMQSLKEAKELHEAKNILVKIIKGKK